MQARHASSCTSTLTGGWTSGEWREGKVPDLGGGGAGGVCEVPRVVGAEVTQSLIEQAHGQGPNAGQRVLSPLWANAEGPRPRAADRGDPSGHGDIGVALFLLYPPVRRASRRWMRG
jgi:hypothetical protein